MTTIGCRAGAGNKVLVSVIVGPCLRINISLEEMGSTSQGKDIFASRRTALARRVLNEKEQGREDYQQPSPVMDRADKQREH